MMIATVGNAQNYEYVIDSSFKPMTFEEMLLPYLLYSQNAERIQQIQAQRRKAEEQRFDEYKEKAYECYNDNDYSGFIYYSAVALETGWYTDKMYYDRGVAFEELHDYKQAKKQYKIALGYGFYPALLALQHVKAHKKEWKQSLKR